ncbi:hypothetical protein Save01_05284 [Streptomyces avermitilis]
MNLLKKILVRLAPTYCEADPTYQYCSSCGWWVSGCPHQS